LKTKNKKPDIPYAADAVKFFSALADINIGNYRRLELEISGFQVSIYRCSETLIRADFKKIS
jgi:hypothetical protein